MILQLCRAVKIFFLKFGFLNFDPCFKNQALKSKIWGLSDQSGRHQSQNASGGFIMTPPRVKSKVKINSMRDITYND